MHIHFAQASYIKQRKFQKIQRKILKVSILTFQAAKHIQKMFYGIGLHSWDPDGSFDILTPILPYLIITNGGCQMRHLCPKCQKCHIWRICHPTHVKYRYGNMGVKRCIRTSGMQTNVIKQLLIRFNSLKCPNSYFQDFPLYFLKFPLYNVRGLGKVDIHHQTFLFAFPSSMGSIFS